MAASTASIRGFILWQSVCGYAIICRPGTVDAQAESVATHDIIVIGASAGGVEALSALVAELPRDLRASVLVVLHVARGRSVLPEILARAGPLPALHPEDGSTLRYGRIYVAPPDHHMTIEADRVRVIHGPTENGVRPAIDPLFRSAARIYGPRVVGVVLTGQLDDGTAGLAAIQEAGGVTVVQDPDEAFAPSMPRSAMQVVAVQHVLPLREIPVLLMNLALEDAARHPPTEPGGHLQPMEPDLGKVPIALRPSDRPLRGRVGVQLPGTPRHVMGSRRRRAAEAPKNVQ